MAKPIPGKIFAGIGLAVAIISFGLNIMRENLSMTIFGIVGTVLFLYGLYRVIQERGTAASVKKEPVKHPHHQGQVHHPQQQAQSPAQHNVTHHPIRPEGEAHHAHPAHQQVQPSHQAYAAHHEGTYCRHCGKYTKDRHGICFMCGRQKN